MGRSSVLHAAAGFLLIALAGRAGVQWALGSRPQTGPPSSDVAVAAVGPSLNATAPEPLGSSSVVYTLYRTAFGDDETVDNTTCEYQVMQQFNCAEPGCHDLAAGELTKPSDERRVQAFPPSPARPPATVAASMSNVQ